MRVGERDGERRREWKEDGEREKKGKKLSKIKLAMVKFALVLAGKKIVREL